MTAIPFEHSLVDRVYVLDEWQLQLEASGRDGLTNRLSELSHDDLLDFAHGIDRSHQNVRRETQNHRNSE
jgi:hypothetical protein